MPTEGMPRVSLALLPTPLEPMSRLTAHLGGPDLWIKRDDQTGLATGGNKTRKLEFLVAEALSQRADTLITAGAAQSNHARQTAAAAARFGLSCTLVLRGVAPINAQGNLLLDRLLGADVVWSGDRPVPDCMNETATDVRAAGGCPYVIPYGGSNPVGASGYVAAMGELLGQCAAQGVSFDTIVTASSSGGTQAGLVVGARALGYAGCILGVSVGPPAQALREAVASLASATAERLDQPFAFSPDDIEVDDSYCAPGYGVVGDLERDAIRTLARHEGLLLDPVYTGRAFGGLLALIQRSAFRANERVLFWHTGGIPALFAYAESLLP